MDKEDFTYDNRNRETLYHWESGGVQDRTLVYDDASRIIQCNTNAGGSTDKTNITFSYDNDNLLKTQEEWGSGLYGDGNHHTITYTYDADGVRASVSLPLAYDLGYDYTARHQLLDVTNSANHAHIVDYTYDKSGNLATRTPNNNSSSSYLCDALNRVYHIAHNFAGASRTLDYAYDKVSRRKYVQRDGGTADGYTYDDNAEMLSFQRDGTLANGVMVTGTGALTSLTYDARGNRKTVTTASTVNYGSNELDQYTSVGSIVPSYGNNGNLTGYNGWSYIYDALSRLTNASGPGGVTATFYYDGLNRQVARTITGEATKYSVWDGWDLAAEFIAGNSLSTSWVHGAGGELVKEGQGSIPQAYYYADALGSTSQVANKVGTLLESYTYDLSGTPSFFDAGGNPLTSAKVSHLFTGQQWYGALSLYDLRNRFMKPDIGRFLQPDPIGFAGDPSNLYRYCGNNPANASDPSGLDLIIATYDTVPGVNHIGIGVFNGSPATSGTYGYNPASDSTGTTLAAGLGFNVPSGVFPDSPSDRVDYVVLNTSPEQDEAVLSFIEFITANSALFDYNFYSNNCGSFFVYDALTVAGIYVRTTPIPRILLNRLKHLPKAQTSGHGGGGGESSGGGNPSGVAISSAPSIAGFYLNTTYGSPAYNAFVAAFPNSFVVAGTTSNPNGGISTGGGVPPKYGKVFKKK